jgi:hypothetical protein
MRHKVNNIQLARQIAKIEIPNIRKQITHISEAAMAAIGEANRVVTIAVYYFLIISIHRSLVAKYGKVNYYTKMAYSCPPCNVVFQTEELGNHLEQAGH